MSTISTRGKGGGRRGPGPSRRKDDRKDKRQQPYKKDNQESKPEKTSDEECADLAEKKREHRDFCDGGPRGKDNPTPKLWKQPLIAQFLVSTITSSELYGVDRDMKYRYDTLSCNPLLKITFATKDEANKITWDYEIAIGAENIVALPVTVKRLLIRKDNLDAASIRDQFLTTFNINNLANVTVERMIAFGKPLGNTKPGLECFGFQLQKSNNTAGNSNRLALRAVQKQCGSKPPAGDKFLQQLNEGCFLIVIRSCRVPHRCVMDEFWIGRLEYCLANGIYAQYKPFEVDFDPDHPKNSDSLLQRALEGKKKGDGTVAKIEHLHWMSKLDQNEEKSTQYETFPAKTWFTSLQEYHIVFSIALLMELDYQRTCIFNVFNDNAIHDAKVKKGLYGTWQFHIAVSNTTEDSLPKLPDRTKFTITRYPAGNERAVDGYTMNCITQNDLVLSVQMQQDASADWEDGLTFKVKLKIELNLEPTIRQFKAIEGMERDKLVSKNVTTLLLGKDYSPLTLEEHDPLINKREELTEEDRRLAENYYDSLSLNYLQRQAFEKTFYGKTTLNVIQGPPGTGKSAVNAAIAIFAALLGLVVLASAPTNQAVKELARKIATEVHAKLPEDIKSRFKVVYNPRKGETIDRLLEWLGYNPITKAYSDSSDKVFEEFQMYRHLYYYVENRAAADDKDAIQWLKHCQMMRTQSRLSIPALQKWKSHAREWMDKLLSEDDSIKIILSTCNNSYKIWAANIKVSIILIDECAFDQEYDVLIPMRFQHDMLVLTGDHHQLRPIVTSDGVNEFAPQLRMSLFERVVGHMNVPFTMLKRNYRMPPHIADLVGILGGYNGLACGENTLEDNDPFFIAFRNWWYSNTNASLRQTRREPLSQSSSAMLDSEERGVRRIFLNVNSKSTRPSGTLSTVNYGNINTIVKFINAFISSTAHGVLPDGKTLAENIVVQVPYAGQQAELIRQLEMRVKGPAATEIAVKTIDSNQGGEKKMVVLDMTVANWTCPGFLGFLRDWNRMNVAISRASQVLVIVGNIDLWRMDLEAIHNQAPSWAMMIMDLIDRGDIIDYYAMMDTLGEQHKLPSSIEEASQPTEFWTTISPESDTKYLPGNFTKQIRIELGAKQQATGIEKAFLQALRAKRDVAEKAIALVDEEEKAHAATTAAAIAAEELARAQKQEEDIAFMAGLEERERMEEEMSELDELEQEVARDG